MILDGGILLGFFEEFKPECQRIVISCAYELRHPSENSEIFRLVLCHGFAEQTKSMGGGGIKMSGEQKGDFLERRKFQSETDIVIRGSSQVLLKTVLLHDTI